jgi:hypothetical protein
MLVFLDFEASSLARHSYPIEVAWVFEDGASEAHLIRPAPGWDDWDAAAEAIHRIPHATLLADGVAHDVVARRMVERLAGHDLTASAPSWDGKWLSTLLRAAGLARRSLRLRDSDEAQREAARAILRDIVPADRLNTVVEDIRIQTIAARSGVNPAHRALADALEERERWRAVREAAAQFRDARGPHSTLFVTQPHD